MDMKLDIFMLLNMAPPQKLGLAPGAIIRRNTVFEMAGLLICLCASAANKVEPVYLAQVCFYPGATHMCS